MNANERTDCPTQKNYSERVLSCALEVYHWISKRISNTTIYGVLGIVLTVTFCSIFFPWAEYEPQDQLNESQDDSNNPDIEKIVNQVTIKSRNPVIVWWTESIVPFVSENIFCNNDIICDVFQHDDKHLPANIGAYLFHASSMDLRDLPLPRQPEKVIWGFHHDVTPNSIHELMYEQTLNLFNFSSTFSRYSDISNPLRYLNRESSITSRKYFVETAVKNSHLVKMAPILFLQSNCDTSTERDAYVEKLMEYIRIDSYGACVKNQLLSFNLSHDYAANLLDDEMLKFMANYKFIITIEKTVCDDYVTNEFWRAIEVGSVPIYFGSPSVRDWFPNDKSAILLEDFPTPQILSEHINKLLDNDNLYEEYLEHKTKDMITNKRLLYELKTRPFQSVFVRNIDMFECFICEKLHQKKGKSVNNIVTTAHYNCPQPVSALHLGVNPNNHFAMLWTLIKPHMEAMCNAIIKTG